MQLLKGIKKLGPGLLFAGAAIGVSHLVWSTKAGAVYGFSILWAVLLANILKYPFFEFGTRYAVSTGETLLEGYKKLGAWALAAIIMMTVGTMFTIQAAVTIVTAGLAEMLFNIQLHPVVWSVIILIICMLVLMIGKYNLLDKMMKYIIVILSVSTLAALIIAVANPTEPAPELQLSFSWNREGIIFLIALMGWMPAPLDLSVWSSIWSIEKQKQVGKMTLKESLFDFNIGYIGTIFLAICFLSLGALVVYGTGEALPEQGGAFARKLIEIYTFSLGSGAYWLIAIAAFTTMFSTTITCLDAFPRVLSRILLLFKKEGKEEENKSSYWVWIIIVAAGAVLLLSLLGGHMGLMVKIATILSFLTAPLFAFINYKLVVSKYLPGEARPNKWLRVLSWLGIIFLTAFSICFLYFWFH